MKLLLVRFSSIPDIILASPLIRCLKKQVSDLELHFLTDDACRYTVEFNPYIDKLHVLAHSWELMVEELKTEGYDWVIDLEHSGASHCLKKEIKAKTISVKNYSWKQAMYKLSGINLFPSSHRIEQCLETAKTFGVKMDGGWLDYFIAPHEETTKNDIPTSHFAGFIACVIADEDSEQWSLQNWIQFCKEIDHPVILLGDKKDAARGQEIAESDPVKIYNACGKFSFNESADLIKKSKLVLAPATGLLYTAAAYKRPLVWLYDGRLPSYTRAPYPENNKVAAGAKTLYLQRKLKDNANEVMKDVHYFL